MIKLTKYVSSEYFFGALKSDQYDEEVIEAVKEIFEKAEKWDELEEKNKDLKFLFEKYHDFLPLGMYNEFVKLTDAGGSNQ